MSKHPEDDLLVINDRTSRRRFVRTGAAFALAGGAAVLGQPLRADECDRGRGAEKSEEQQAQAGSDSDAGASADAPGCGVKTKPKISRHEADPLQPGAGVTRISG